MNLKTTPLLFGVMLGILWVFGLLLVYKKGAVDENFIVPGMQGPDVKVDSVKIVYGEGKKDKAETDVVFQRENDRWYLSQNNVKVRVETFRIDDLVRQVKDAKRYEEERTQDDLRYYNLPPSGTPRMVVTLKGKVKERDKTWTFNVGNTGAGEFTVYVNSSDRPGRAYPVVRSQIDALFFKDTADLRPKRLFDIVEPTVTTVLAAEGKDELELKKVENSWRFVKPPLGFAGFEAASGALEDPKTKAVEKEGGVKGLIGAITAVRVESDQDFEPPGARSLADYGLESGKETMRLALGSGPEKKPAKKEEKKDDEKAEPEDNREVLLIGNRASQPAGKKGAEPQYYARMASDDGVFRVSAKQLEPIKEDIHDPKRIRSHDVVAYDPKKVDAVVLEIAPAGKDAKKAKVELFHPADKDWEVRAAGDKTRKGNEKAIQALIEALEGKKEIKEFADGKDKAWGGLDGSSTTEISVYLEGLEKDKKKDDKDAKKDDKKDAKETIPTLKKGEPFVKLVIGTIDKEQKVAHVKRILQDGTESRFTVPYAYVEKLHLDNGALAFVDTALPSLTPGDVVAVDIGRGKDKVELDRTTDNRGLDRWSLRDVHDPLGGKLADRDKVAGLVKNLTSLTARKWVKKDDAAALGLKDPQLVVSLFTKKEERLTAAGAASLVGAAATPELLPVVGTALANRQADRGDLVTIKFGKEIEEDKQKLVYVEHSGTDLVALEPAELVKQLRDIDLRDRSAVARTEGELGATLIALAAEPSFSAVLAAPLATGVVNAFDPGKVKEMTVALRTKVELRSFTFKRIGKEKTWEEVSGVKEFQVDTDKIVQLVEQVSKLRTNRFASFGGPTGDSKLTAKEATLRVELTFEDNSTVTLTVGAAFGQLGYFAHSSAWPEAVFFVPALTVDPWLQGPAAFGKERVTAGL